MACNFLEQSGNQKVYTCTGDRSKELEDTYVLSDDPRVTFNKYCLRVYPLTLYGNILLLYHANRLSLLGGVNFHLDEQRHLD